jgi:hypothetical protein
LRDPSPAQLGQGRQNYKGRGALTAELVNTALAQPYIARPPQGMGGALTGMEPSPRGSEERERGRGRGKRENRGFAVLLDIYESVRLHPSHLVARLWGAKRAHCGAWLSGPSEGKLNTGGGRM